MALVLVPQSWLITNDQAWLEPYFLWADKAQTIPIAVTAASAWLQSQIFGSSPLALTVGNGGIALSNNVATVTLSKAVAQTLAAGAYDLEVQLIGSDGLVRQLRRVVEIRQGLAS